MKQALPLPNLPPELVGSILEMSAELVRENAPTLLLVSRNLKKWVEPILYRTVVLRTEDTARKFLDTVHARKQRDPIFFDHCIHAIIFVQGDFGLPPSHSSIATILDACSAVSSVSLYTSTWLSTESKVPEVLLHRLTAIKQLYLVQTPREVFHTHVIPNQITHLCLGFSDDWDHSPIWPIILSCCPYLTHLMLHQDIHDFIAFEQFEHKLPTILPFLAQELHLVVFVCRILTGRLLAFDELERATDIPNVALLMVLPSYLIGKKTQDHVLPWRQMQCLMRADYPTPYMENVWDRAARVCLAARKNGHVVHDNPVRESYLDVTSS
ncbi:hypothetical protein CYLTODRAFT_485084 [Cylindrobasidium torrendii FP15055 ss-10]|uniref:F-box domain-containing protein n=1 Tax=Cylindrobasidium torrendii FP15055 ss-10 TaxID=1314674 RepID=A0A0D7BUM4_9AGAR|nr:hypothetical protein CYLTODRAFT_485084 [Cylindrobasidium torrendii FP15055 ss-10]